MGEVFAYDGSIQNLKNDQGQVPVSAYGGSSKNLQDLKGVLYGPVWTLCVRRP